MHRRRGLWVLGPFLTFAVATAQAAERVSFERTDDHLAIRIDGKPFADYSWRDREIKRPFFMRLHAPSGAVITRQHPPVEGRDAVDHATMHPGLWLAFGDLSGADFWRNQGTIRHDGFLAEPSADEHGGQFAASKSYVSGDNKIICEEVCRIRIVPKPNGVVIDWRSEFTGPREFYFGDQEEMGLGVRVATPMTVVNGGKIANSDGLVNENQIWGKQSDWCDYSGVIDGKRVGVMLMPDPKNFRRAWFHARDYGLLVANPFGANAFTGGEKSKIVVKPGETFRLHFGVFVHEGDVDLKAAYSDWLKQTEATAARISPPLSREFAEQIKSWLDADIARLTKSIETNANDAGALMERGGALFKRGRFKEAAADFDRTIELDPARKPYHWQRGIALYYAGRYADSAAQFDAYHAIDKIDRENGIWRCLAQIETKGLDEARKDMIAYERPDRVPMIPVYEMFAGRKQPSDVLHEIATAKIGSDERAKRLFYAELYAGLYWHAQNRPDLALEHLRNATANEWGQKAGGGPGYMWHVARVHYDLLAGQSPR